MSNVVGIGIDLVSVRNFERQLSIHKDVFINHTFSGQEIEDAELSTDKICFYAGRFAVKEAVFKAVAPRLSEKAFDFRMVETKRQPDGSPEIYVNERFQKVIESAGISKILISISNEDGFVIAIAEALAK